MPNGAPERPVLPRVALIAGAGAEEDAAWTWLRAAPDVAAALRFTPFQVDDAVREAAVVWVHAAGPVEPSLAAPLAAFAAAGGGVLLTLRACGLVTAMGLEATPPNDHAAARWHDDTDEFFTADFRGMGAYPHVRGLATYGPHPLVDGFVNGTYCWAPRDGEPWVRTTYAHGVRPAHGRVIAVERAYVTQNPGRIVAWEYAPGAGRVLCIGAYAYFAAPDRLLRPQLERLAANALRRVAGADGEAHYWPAPAATAAPWDAPDLPEPPDLDGGLPEPTEDDLLLASEAAADAPFDLAGRRALLVGHERRGIAELWMYPHRAVASWDVAVDGEPPEAVRVEVTPDVVRRTLDTAKRRILETSFLALEHAVAVVEYRAARLGRASVARAPGTLELTLTLDLRRMWPFAAGCGGTLRFAHRADGRAAVVTTDSGDGIVALFPDRPAEIVLKGLSAGSTSVVECTVTAPIGVPFRLAVVGGPTRADLDRTLRAVERLGVAGLVRQRAQRGITLREARAAVRAPDPTVVRALEWAKRRLDLFTGDVPGVGRSLLAGYADTRAGWGEGRPGYAWFFGRDACWSAFALLAAGEFSVPRQIIRFLGDTQDITGKVAHEVTASGQAHYDAADATPLYLLLVARYLAWSGDRDFVRATWSHVMRALTFALGTDADGDGLIENARVGHGWIESGPLGGAHVTLYLAGVWRAALDQLARAADALGEAELAADCRARAARAAEAIVTRFFDARHGRFALDLRADGRRTWTQTAEHGAAFLLGAASPAQARAWLDAVATDAFSADWGVRMLPTDDPHFQPTSYHGGAVWPLFTGWAAGVEYRLGRPAAGFRHLMANARLAWARQLGAFDEVLHGTEERSAGVCADQAWSAAMVISPLIEGLFGAEPDAPNGRLTLAPALPAVWDAMELRGLRCGDSVFDVRVRRRRKALELSLRRTLGPPLWLTVAPWLDAAPPRVEVDGQNVAPVALDADGIVRHGVSFQAGGEHDLRFVAG